MILKRLCMVTFFDTTCMKPFSYQATVKGGTGMTEDSVQGDYVAIRAKDNGVQVIGLTRGQDTKFHHAEKLDKGEVMLAQFTSYTSAIKVRGKAQIFTKFGVIDTED
jgi:transcription attenuation protein (tryptophan RNA-binding attenuator protein)